LRVLLHFWTATGNTRLAADLVADGLLAGGADEVHVRDIRAREPFDLTGYGLWVIATPVYAFRPALAVTDFLHELNGLPAVPAAAAFTYAGFYDRAPSKLARALRRAGVRPWDWTALRCEDAWPVARKYLPPICSYGEPSDEARARFRGWWQEVPERLRAGSSGRSWMRLPTPFTLLSMLYSRPLVRWWFRIRVDPDRCTRCGLCVDHCPTGRMQMDRFPNPRGDCLGCYGCVNICPERAVETFLTRGAPPYRGPRRSDLGE